LGGVSDPKGTNRPFHTEGEGRKRLWRNKLLDKNFCLYYIVYMVRYEDEIIKKIAKRQIPQDIFVHINNAFMALDLTKDMNLFDIKQLKKSKGTERIYYRLRKSKYRAIFYLEGNDIWVVALDKRELVYKKWQ
jgi:mRNA interferase RelE/StbE